VKLTLWPRALGFVALAKVVELVTLLTCCVTVFDVDVALNASPLYTAVIEWEPTDKVDVGHDALPLLKVTAEQIAVAPSLNVTVPVGDRPVTVVVKVTPWPKVLGFVALLRLDVLV
jgi:hypothetical protein